MTEKLDGGKAILGNPVLTEIKVNQLIEHLPELVEEIVFQLEADEVRWGDTWRRRPLEGQEDRTFSRFADYYDQFDYAGTPIPWLKVIGNAYICWLRERYPELLVEE